MDREKTEREGFYIEPIAYIETDFPEKFGIPRQSGLSQAFLGRIVFTPDYRSKDALREIEGFSHLWLIWQFSAALNTKWHATVRPPKLGGNRHVGVFASRSPFRPNHLGLSCVKLLSLEDTPEGTVLWVSGVDMLNHTPIFDIKPYLPYTDCHAEAASGYTKEIPSLQVNFPSSLLALVPPGQREGLKAVLASDPRPGYAQEGKQYGVSFGSVDVGFLVKGDTVHVLRVEPLTKKSPLP